MELKSDVRSIQYYFVTPCPRLRLIDFANVSHPSLREGGDKLHEVTIRQSKYSTL